LDNKVFVTAVFRRLNKSRNSQCRPQSCRCPHTDSASDVTVSCKSVE